MLTISVNAYWQKRINAGDIGAALLAEMEGDPGFQVVTGDQSTEASDMMKFSEAARCDVLPRPVSIKTIHAWRRDGILTKKGRVHLECTRMAGRWLVSREALERFLTAISC